MKEEKKNISIKEMLQLSTDLYEKNKHKWGEKTPESNIYWLAFLVTEVAEVIDIVKKKGSGKIMTDENIRKDTLTEIADCFMMLSDILNRYEFNAEEFSEVYVEKMRYNLNRDFEKSRIKSEKENI